MTHGRDRGQQDSWRKSRSVEAVETTYGWLVNPSKTLELFLVPVLVPRPRGGGTPSVGDGGVPQGTYILTLAATTTAFVRARSNAARVCVSNFHPCILWVYTLS